MYVFGGYRFHVEAIEPSGELYTLYYPNLTWSLLVPSRGNKVIEEIYPFPPLAVFENKVILSLIGMLLFQTASVAFLPCGSPTERHHGDYWRADRSRRLQQQCIPLSDQLQHMDTARYPYHKHHYIHILLFHKYLFRKQASHLLKLHCF